MKTTNPRLAHIVARRYRDMQGLVTVSDAMFPLLLGAGAFYFRSDRAMILFGGCLVVWFFVSVFWLRRRISAYYANRFGRVGGFAIPIIIVIAQGYTTGSLLADLHVPLAIRVPIVFLFLGGWPAWIVAYDWPYRWYWIIPLVVAAGVTVPFSGRAVELGDISLATCLVAIGAALAIAGALDHALLVRALDRPAGSEAAEHA